MIRNLKVLGLAFAAVLAFSALSAAAASAQTPGKLTIEGGGSATLDVTETVGGLNALTALGGTTKCPGSTMTGHKITTTPHEPVPNLATEVTLTPNFINCITTDGAGSEHKMTITMTTCDFHAKLGETTGGVEHTYGVSLGVTCTEPDDVIHIEIYPFRGSELGGVACSITLTPTTLDLTGAHITHTTAPADDIDIKGTVGPFHVVVSGAACAGETDNDATQHIDVTVKGTTAGGENLNVTVTH